MTEAEARDLAGALEEACRRLEGCHDYLAVDQATEPKESRAELMRATIGVAARCRSILASQEIKR